MTARRCVIASCLLTLGCACGIPTQDDATRVPSDQVPFGLAAPASATTSTTGPAQSTEVTVYFIEAGRLVASPRRLAQPVSIADVLDAVVNGPTEDEARAGLRSAIVEQGLLARASVTGSVATVDLGTRFTALPSDEQVLALAQLVYTATALPGIGPVAFTLEGSPIPVPRADGSLTDAPVTRVDYASLMPGVA